MRRLANSFLGYVRGKRQDGLFRDFIFRCSNGCDTGHVFLADEQKPRRNDEAIILQVERAQIN